MANPLIRKLEGFAHISHGTRDRLAALTERVQHMDARQSIFRDGDDPTLVDVVLSGWAFRYKALLNGQRQITALLLPGDMCDPYVFLLRSMGHSIGTLTPVTLARVPAQGIRDLSAGGAEFGEALWRQMLQAVEIQREWTVSLGRRTALQRLAHLFCEVTARLNAVGLSDGSECDLPLTQADLADALGLSAVHINRSLQELRASRLIELRNKRLTIHDRQGLMDLAMFDPRYLHGRAG